MYVVRTSLAPAAFPQRPCSSGPPAAAAMQQRPSRNAHASAALPQRPCRSGPPATAMQERPSRRSGPFAASLSQRPTRSGPVATALSQRPLPLARCCGCPSCCLISCFVGVKITSFSARLGYGSSFGQPGYRAKKIPGTGYRVPGTAALLK